MSCRLLMLNYEFPPIGGGAANAHYCILREYAKMSGLRVDVLTSAPRPGFFQDTIGDNVRIYKVGINKKDLHYWRKLEVIEWLVKAWRPYRKLLKENNYDLVHCFFGFPSGYLSYKTRAQIPYIISLRGSDVPGFNTRLGFDYKLLGRLFRRIWTSAAILVANSKGLKELGMEFAPDLDISVIPNGVDTERFFPRGNKSFGDSVRLLTVCRLISRKRIDLLIRAVAKTKEEGLNISFDIVGEGNLLGSLRALAAELGLSNDVRFLGRVDPEQMPTVYRDNDVFVMASKHEGMSNAMLEAMASGLPIITTKCEGLDELIDENGIIVDNPTARSIAEAIRKVVEDRVLYESMSICARERAAAFSWEKSAWKYLEIYGKVSGRA